MSIKPLVIGVTMGDPAGIGPEITTALLAERVHEKEVRAVLIGCAKTVEETARRKGLNVSIRRHEVLKRNELRSGGIDVYDPDVFDGTLVQPGDITFYYSYSINRRLQGGKKRQSFEKNSLSSPKPFCAWSSQSSLSCRST